MTFADIKMKMTAMQFSFILSIPLSSFANANPSKTHHERLKAKLLLSRGMLSKKFVPEKTNELSEESIFSEISST